MGACTESIADSSVVGVAITYTEAEAVLTCSGIVDFHIEAAGSLSSETNAPGGVVLDFALISRLVNVHGGKLALRDNKTSCVTISLPLGSAHLPPDRLYQGTEPPAYEVSKWDDSDDGSLSSPMSVRGVDRSTLQFEPTDCVLLVDGKRLHSPSDHRLRLDAVHADHLSTALQSLRSQGQG